MRTEKPIGQSFAEIDGETRKRLAELEAQGIVLAQFVDLFGADSDGLALEWSDLGVAAIVIKMRDFPDVQHAIRHLIRAWDASQQMMTDLRKASVQAVMDEGKGATRQ